MYDRVEEEIEYSEHLDKIPENHKKRVKEIFEYCKKISKK